MSAEKIDSANDQMQSSLKIPALFWWVVALLPIAFKLFLGLRDVAGSWDDGAIAAAFSRTWAETGRIALTPVSQVVEGFSSVLWFLLLSVPYFFTHSPDAGLIWMKILSAVFAGLSLPVMYLIALRQFASRNAAIVSMLLLGFCYTLEQEIDSGMEMNLAVFLMLLLFYLLTREQVKGRVANASVVACLLLLTRFEMPFMLGLLFCGLLYAAYEHRPGAVPVAELLKIFTIAVIFFCVGEVWRHHVFGGWAPNTIYAKRFLPYRDWSTPWKFLHTRLKAVNEPLFVLRYPIVLVLMVLIRAKYRGELGWSRLERIHPAVWSLTLGCFLFGAMFGQNWGHAGRMVSAGIPFLILVVVGVCVGVVQDRRVLVGVLAALVVIQAVTWGLFLAHPFRRVSIRTIGVLGPGADAIRVALHQDRVVVMMSDVGGSSLCCERLAVLDSGLLADATLGRVGWAGFVDYFRRSRPEVVETHSYWTVMAPFYQGLLDGYSIVASNGVRFFVRDDLYQRLVDEKAGPVLPVASVPACLTQRVEDAAFSRTKQTCLVLNDPEADRNLP